jgi:hypothetical protein
MIFSPLIRQQQAALAGYREVFLREFYAFAVLALPHP